MSLHLADGRAVPSEVLVSEDRHGRSTLHGREALPASDHATASLVPDNAQTGCDAVGQPEHLPVFATNTDPKNILHFTARAAGRSKRVVAAPTATSSTSMLRGVDPHHSTPTCISKLHRPLLDCGLCIQCLRITAGWYQL